MRILSCMLKFGFGFELAAGVGSLYARRGIPPGCHFNMAFIVALHLPWCRYLEVVGGFRPQLYADNLMCVRSHLNAFLVAARFTTRSSLGVGQAAAPSVCLCVCASQRYRRFGYFGNWGS